MPKQPIVTTVLWGEDVPPLEGEPACADVDQGLWRLFDSVREEDHIYVAMEFCRLCPAKASCLDRREWISAQHPYAKPEGTWGGLLFNTKGQQKKVKPNKYVRYRAA